MSEIVGVLHGIPAPEDRWDESQAAGLDAIDGLVYRSNLLGADRALANRGGGNTSVKQTIVDHAGRSTRTLWVKGSGTDLATIAAAGFPGLRLDELLLLREREQMSDAEMVDYLLRSAISPDQPRPSIETLLHAFIAAPHVDHTHPDAVIALTSNPSGRELARKTFGDEAVWLDYERPGFAMSRKIALLLEANPRARAVLLAKHGLVTWGETGEESHAGTIEFVTRAANAIESAAGGSFGLGGPAVQALPDAAAERILAASLPTLRGALMADADGVVLELDRSPKAVAFASAARTPDVSQIGAPCPDHLINTKHKPLVIDFDPDTGGAAELREAFERGVGEYASWYREYYERNLDDETRQFPCDPAGPRVILIPGIGIVTSGPDAGRARFARDLYHRAIAVQDAADALGGFRSLSESEAFAIEYWPLERYKLSRAPAPGELAGRVAVITGGASGIGRATARLLAQRGAHVVLADLNLDGAQEVADQLVAGHGLRRATGVGVDVTSEGAVEEMFARAVLEYGGVDIVIASAGLASSSPVVETTLADWERNYAVLARGTFLATREGFRVMLEQGRGGSIVVVASKNALVAGANASAYSSAKAAALHLARCLAEEGGPHGIRVNTVNPDAVLEGSSIWSSNWKAERASTYGVDADDLQSFYRDRTKLNVNVFPEDVAEAVAYFAGPKSAKSTGNVLNVDGGVTAAYPR
ncbi:MAG TPA: bifunctional rhamnulose-1-phosphate aldolase/short-chain dehydrogenase [Solirubrobacteraceae bacterium]|jgi:rhamnulose-1-phosphate aldolase/alcohol dehydrogenase|nr:bifunctional rhamnulose-1-phosphate aldolase/short-chain dehydrogenase [Solirubrobacteraceae bacterium]